MSFDDYRKISPKNQVMKIPLPAQFLDESSWFVVTTASLAVRSKTVCVPFGNVVAILAKVTSVFHKDALISGYAQNSLCLSYRRTHWIKVIPVSESGIFLLLWRLK